MANEKFPIPVVYGTYATWKVGLKLVICGEHITVFQCTIQKSVPIIASVKKNWIQIEIYYFVNN